MRLAVDTRFQRVTLEKFVEIYYSEPFNEAVATVSGLKSRKLVEERVDDAGIRHRRVRMEPAVTLPGPVQALADKLAGGKAAITYDEVTEYDTAKHTARFRMDHKAMDRVRFEGTIRFLVDGDGVRRVIDGVVEVKAPLVGGIVERFIESETQKGYVKIAAFLQKWLDEH